MHYTKSPYYQRAPRRYGRWAMLICLAIVLSICWIFYTKERAAFGSPSMQPVVTVQQTAAEKAAQVHQAALTAAAKRIKDIIATYPGVQFSVAIYDFSDKSTTHIGSTAPFDAASTAKLITAADVLAQVERGTYQLDTVQNGKTIDTWLELLIVNSDDRAWQTLNDMLGHPQMNRYASSIGLKNYDADTNTITADDMTIVLQKLYNESLLSKTYTSLLLGYMKQANYREYVVAAAAPATVYHKVGWNDAALNDVAIIDNGSSHFAIAIYSDNKEPLNGTEHGTALRAITAAAMTAFTET